MIIVDAHLDLAYNGAVRGRNLAVAAREQPVTHNEIPTVGFPDLRAGGVGLICATIFAEPAHDGEPGYTTADEARAAGLRQLEWYRGQEAAGRIRFINGPKDLPTGDENSAAVKAILLMEGADVLRSPADVGEWFAAGLRIVGLAWKRTRAAGGTGAPGPLTAGGVALVRELDRFGIIHDASHLAEESFYQLLDLSDGPVMASHSNCRTIVPTDRQLSDGMIQGIVRRGGVIGMVFFDKFMMPPAEYGKRRATLADLIRHVKHVCDLAGDAEHVGIGTDFDGGVGREQIPVELTSAADLPRVAEALAGAGFDDRAVAGVMGRNWLRFFRENLAGP